MESDYMIYKEFLDNLDIGAFILDNKGHYLYVNDMYCKISGKSKSFFYRTSILQLKKEGYLSVSIWEYVMQKKKAVPSILTIKDISRSFIYDVLSIGIPHFNDNNEIDFVFFTQEPIDHINTKLQQSIEFNASFVTQLNEPSNTPEMIAESPKMKSLLSSIDPVIPTDATILINGPSGSGKEVLANYIHKTSLRKDGPFIVLNCGAIPENLIESELFGYEKGAFTGASSSGKTGVIETADKGTLFLDEINSMPTSMQTKLLRVLETRLISRIGSTKEKQIDFRLICASNENLHQLVESHQFRPDLFYRINVISVSIPPLCERKEDIIPLANLFLRKICEKYKLVKCFDDSVLHHFEQYNWPGNIRELRNITERMALTSSKTEVKLYNIPDYLLKRKELKNPEIESADYPLNSASEQPLQAVSEHTIDWNTNTRSFKECIADAEKELLCSAMDYYGTPAKAAHALQIDISNIYRKLNKYNLIKKRR